MPVFSWLGSLGGGNQPLGQTHTNEKGQRVDAQGRTAEQRAQQRRERAGLLPGPTAEAQVAATNPPNAGREESAAYAAARAASMRTRRRAAGGGHFGLKGNTGSEPGGGLAYAVKKSLIGG